MTMRCLGGKIHSISPTMQMFYYGAAQHEKSRISNQIQRVFSFSSRQLLVSSMPLFSNTSQDNIESNMNLHINFDHTLWWKAHGRIVRHLLEGGNKGSDCELLGDLSNSSLQLDLPRNHFEKTYATDAIYQDLFIDSPPCRDTLKLSFELINRYWEINIIKWNPPILMTAISNCKMKHAYKNTNEMRIINQKSSHFDKNMKVKAMGTRSRVNNIIFLRIPYTATQRPRLAFLPRDFCNKIPLFSVLNGFFFEFEYEGWIDLYLRPASSPAAAIKTVGSDNNNNDCSDCGSSNWKVYRHEDRLRVYPPKPVSDYIQGIDQHENGGDTFDALTVIEKAAFVSTIFQWCRWAHGMTVQHFAKKNSIKKVDDKG